MQMSMSEQASQAEQSSRLKEALEPFVSRGGLAGAVVATADKDKILAIAAVGWADAEAQQPMQPDTLFWIASQTKPITATALMMLVDEGKVRLDNPVEDYLPGLKDPWVIEEQDDDHLLLRKAERKVTVRDLLRHTSGMPFRSAMEEPTIDRLVLAEAIRSYAAAPLLFQPGTRYSYSNTGINAAGRIIEVAAGMPYEMFLQQRLFDPLGMTETTFHPTAEQLQRLAKSYKPNEAKTELEAAPIWYLHYPLDDPARQPVPGGGLFSTAADVVKFCRMILNGGQAGGRTYLSPEAVAEMTRRQTDASFSDSYGLGWAVGPDSFGHGGAQGTQMNIHPERGLITVFMIQHDGYLFDGDQAYPAFAAAATA